MHQCRLLSNSSKPAAKELKNLLLHLSVEEVVPVPQTGDQTVSGILFLPCPAEDVIGFLHSLCRKEFVLTAVEEKGRRGQAIAATWG